LNFRVVINNIALNSQKKLSADYELIIMFAVYKLYWFYSSVYFRADRRTIPPKIPEIYERHSGES